MCTCCVVCVDVSWCCYHSGTDIKFITIFWKSKSGYRKKLIILWKGCSLEDPKKFMLVREFGYTYVALAVSQRAWKYKLFLILGHLKWMHAIAAARSKFPGAFAWTLGFSLAWALSSTAFYSQVARSDRTSGHMFQWGAPSMGGEHVGKHD